MLTLQSHTFASRTSQNTSQSLQKSVPVPTHGQKDKAAKIKDKNGQLVTKCICHKGFSGYSSVVARSNFRVGGQVTAPQSLTAHTLDRYQQAENLGCMI